MKRWTYKINCHYNHHNIYYCYSFHIWCVSVNCSQYKLANSRWTSCSLKVNEWMNKWTRAAFLNCWVVTRLFSVNCGRCRDVCRPSTANRQTRQVERDSMFALCSRDKVLANWRGWSNDKWRWKREKGIEEKWCSQSTFQRMLLVDSLRESLMRSRTVWSFCFWAISDWVTSATFSFSPSSFSVQRDKKFDGEGREERRWNNEGFLASSISNGNTVDVTGCPVSELQLPEPKVKANFSLVVETEMVEKCANDQIIKKICWFTSSIRLVIWICEVFKHLT